MKKEIIMIANIKTGTVVQSTASGKMLKVTKVIKSGKTLTANDTLTVAEFDGKQSVRGTARNVKVDSLRRRYHIVA